MRKYYKRLEGNGDVSMLLAYDFSPVITDPLVVEITETEYNQIHNEIEAMTNTEQDTDDEITDSEALSIILGGDGA